MTEVLNHYHWLRPLWLLLIPLPLLLGWGLSRLPAGQTRWAELIRPELLQHLIESNNSQRSHGPLLALVGGWLLACLALAGPSWHKLPQPVYSQQDALVLILDLSPSMHARDLTPDRLTHARHRLIDLINARDEGLTALVVYAGDAHVLAPLSDDKETLLNLIAPLSPAIMPVSGSQTEAAIETAVKLLRDAGHQRGQILLITDGIAANAFNPINSLLGATEFSLSIVGVGTTEGAPIPLSDGSFAKTADGELPLARLDPQPLRQLAERHRGIYRTLSYTGAELEALNTQLQADPNPFDTNSVQALEREFDRWDDVGPWLVLLLLPLAALAHRRGLVLVLLIAPLGLPQPAQAFDWQDLWNTSDQQGAAALAEGDYEQAAGSFNDPDWRGTSLYRNGQYSEAAEQFARTDTPTAHYNRGNALAKAGQLEPALEAYQQALQQQPEFDDARFNQQLVEQLLQQQQQQQQQQDADGQPPERDNPQSDASQHNEQPADSAGSSDPNRPSNNNQQQNTASPAQTGSSPEPSNAEPSPTQPSPQPQTEQPSQAPAEQEQAEAQSDPIDSGQAQSDSTNPRDPELEQWLNQLPDDPSGLLRRKFEYQYRQKLELYRQGRWQPPEETRW